MPRRGRGRPPSHKRNYIEESDTDEEDEEFISKSVNKQDQTYPRSTRLQRRTRQVKSYDEENDDGDKEIDSLTMPPKKKYRISHRKSTEDIIVIKTINVGWTDETLKLECGNEDLSPAQEELFQKGPKDEEEVKVKLDQCVKQGGGIVETVYKGDAVTAYQITGPQNKQQPVQASVAPMTSTTTTNMVLQQKGNGNTYQLVMDPRLGGFLVTPMTSTAGNVKTSNAPVMAPLQPLTVQSVRPPPLQSQSQPQIKERRRGRPPGLLHQAIRAPLPTHTQQQPTPAAPAAVSTVSIRPTEGTAIGGLTTGVNTSKQNNTSMSSAVVDLTDDDRPSLADSREISFNKLQGKTFPSLVVVARPHLRVKDGPTGDRSKLDGKVKGVLMHVPTKFTEWLIQQGLIRSEQTCLTHPTTKLKLGMYSDVSKFPYSGGYVWISECCPQRFVSVFSGSLFEGSPHPPSVILKLIYHWACQTNVQNVVQWVKVDNLYVKGLNTWLRAVCTVALHTHIVPLGGPGRKVEVGVISLGTTSQDGHQRQVKVEVLGILETDAKLLRLRAVEPLADNDKNYKRRFVKILEPLTQWVHPDSIIITDLTVDKSTLHQLGFTNVVQNGTVEQGNSNQTIMDYLRRIVPRMFQNTLSLLSRQIIQQFLDELVWREWFGITAAQAFDNIITHIAEQTRFDSGNTLISRLYKVSANPFKYWGLTPQSVPNKGSSSANLTILNSIATNNIQPVTIINQEASTSGRQKTATVTIASKPTSAVAIKSTSSPAEGTNLFANLPKRQSRKRVAAPVALRDFTPSPEPSPPPPPKQLKTTVEISEQCVPVDNYYYGTIEGRNTSMDKVSLNVKCSACKANFTDNIKLMDHLLAHAHNVSGNINQCRYCLASVASADGLQRHIDESHPCETRTGNGFVCLICEMKFPKSNHLGKHMSKEHVSGELPYQCGSCGFRTSSHRHAINHFYTKHKGEATLQCPFCLKTFTVMAGNRMMTQQTTFFLQHLQKHQKKAMAKKCTKCALWFVQKEVLKEHLIKMHTSIKTKPGFVPWKQGRDVVMVPRWKKTTTKDADDAHEMMLHLDLNLTGIDAICLECNINVNDEHYEYHESCFKCQYSTLCKMTMNNHLSTCAREINTVVPPLPLDKVLHCVCGFKSQDGNQLAKHLVQCERKSAYPSEESAKAATVTHSMLDVLGLVRRPEEPQMAVENDGASKESKPDTPPPVAEDEVYTVE